MHQTVEEVCGDISELHFLPMQLSLTLLSRYLQP